RRPDLHEVKHRRGEGERRPQRQGEEATREGSLRHVLGEHAHLITDQLDISHGVSSPAGWTRIRRQLSRFNVGRRMKWDGPAAALPLPPAPETLDLEFCRASPVSGAEPTTPTRGRGWGIPLNVPPAIR